ncbi:hypothetical protein BBD42_15620 [Paenibacillus sp. BIHB 4019]|uniref:DUF3168 domain-containing protein n=1 Tax=Paenibacillus sp. BIHB 4019 TaxID=1870819 RepID=A0A1B2DJ87_9BACL|nr:hypothetical protein [Paenibacillus sp. BIHB 4019]ANY67735.1 hypothetical protein BBD42_15620 [Paenibacillus sp. BIHB 4019]
MGVVNELESIETFVKATFPDAMTEKQIVPREPYSGLFVIRLINDGRTTETFQHYRADRDYQVIYFGAQVADVLAKMDALSTALYDRNLIPINASSRYIRVGAFSFAQPFETDGDLFASIGVLRAQVRERRTQADVPLIAEVRTEITTKI